MKSFVRTVETGSFSAVAREFSTTQPTISKQIAALEEHLGVRLLTRSTRHLGLTAEGSRYYDLCRSALEAVEEAEASVAGHARPAGTLRVNCPVSFGQMQIVPRLLFFFQRYPEINIDLMLNDRVIDLIEEGVDVAIRVGELQNSSLIARRIGMTRRIVVATPAYLQNTTEPVTPRDLAHHECITNTRLSALNEWHFTGPQGHIQVKISGRCRIDNSAAIRQAVLAGLGITIAPIWMFGDEIAKGSVKVLLRDYEPTPAPIHTLFTSRRFQAKKISVFIDFLAAEFKLDPWLSDYGH